MMKNEFIERVRQINGGIYPEFTSEDWEIIEKVYTYHPSINEVTGKDQIAYLYFHYGMRVIKDMYPTAEEAEKLEHRILALRTELDSIMEQYEKLKR